MNRFIAFLLLPMAALWVACGDDDDNTTNNTPPPSNQEIFRVVLDGQEFTSQSVDTEYFEDSDDLYFDGILDGTPNLDEFFAVSLNGIPELGTHPSSFDLTLEYDGEDFAYYSEEGTCTVNIVQHSRSARFLRMTAQGFLVGGDFGNPVDTLVLNEAEFALTY